MIPIRVLGLPQSIETDKRPDKKFSQGFIGAPAAAGWEQKQVTVPPARSPAGVVSWFLTWGEGSSVFRGQAGRVT